MHGVMEGEPMDQTYRRGTIRLSLLEHRPRIRPLDIATRSTYMDVGALKCILYEINIQEILHRIYLICNLQKALEVLGTTKDQVVCLDGYAEPVLDGGSSHAVRPPTP